MEMTKYEHVHIKFTEALSMHFLFGEHISNPCDFSVINFYCTDSSLIFYVGFTLVTPFSIKKAIFPSSSYLIELI